MIKSPVAPHVKGAMGLRSDKCVIHCHFEETSLGFVYPAGTSHQKLLRISSKLSVQEIGTKRSKHIFV